MSAKIEFRLQRRYTRSDPRGLFPHLTGLPGIAHNRLASFWRPIIDMTDSEMAPMRLRFVAPISAWLADPQPDRWSWFAMIGVTGQRHQVIRHAGLHDYDAREPADLAEHLRTPQWNRLLEAIERFDELDYPTRSLVMFQLLQLSYCEFVLKLTGMVLPNGDPAHDRYAYEVARTRARYRYQDEALHVYRRLAVEAKDPLRALASCGQGIGLAVRHDNDIELARWFERSADEIRNPSVPDTWHAWLVRSRYHRAVALLRMAERQLDEMRQELERSQRFSDLLSARQNDGLDQWDRWVALENQRILTESRIKAASRAPGNESAAEIGGLCEELDRLDPYCGEARLVIADGYLTAGDYEEAAMRYARAGELGTVAGAVGWFRAAQCYDYLGDRGSALNAMARCVELDASAVEAVAYLENFSPTQAAGGE